MSTLRFGGRRLGWLIGISIVSFVGGVVLTILAPDLAPVTTVAPSGFSRSALGHQALVALLEQLDVPVVVSRHHSASKVGPGGVLVAAEPRVDRSDLLPDGEDPGRRLDRMVRRAPATLLVLPKWEGRPDIKAPNWVREVTLVDRTAAQAVLNALGLDAQVVRVPASRLAPKAEAEGADGAGALPEFPGATVQLVQGPALEPVVRTPDGALVAEVQGWGGRLLILADPDPLSNAGLLQGRNAVFVLETIDALREEGGAVVFDETLHGFETDPSIWRELFAFPLVLVPLHFLLLLGVLLWTTMGRFGAPQKPPPALEPGTAFLVSNTAELLRHGVSTPRVLGRYLEVSLRQVTTALNGPPNLEGKARDTWLDRVAARRDVDLRVSDLRAAAGHAEGKPARVRAAARVIHRWREEILHGSVRRTHAA